MTSKLKRLQKISHRLNRDRTEVATEFVCGLKHALAKRGYRADLSISTEAASTKATFTAAVPFDSGLGHPTEKDLVTLVAQAYPTHEIDWDLVNVDPDLGVILLSLAPSAEVIPIDSIRNIPPTFVSLGTGLYKRSLDSTVDEIWTLKRGENGLLLYRNDGDVEVKADDNEFKAGDVADTPHGPGRIIRFDDYGNAFVQVGNRKRLVAAKELGMYNIDRERKKLTDYYTEAYGDPEFARALTKNYDTAGGGSKKKKK